MAISPETAATTRSIFSMLSRTPGRSTSTPWTLRGRRKRQPSSTRTTERRAKQEERRSPLTDSNRRPPPYHLGATGGSRWQEIWLVEAVSGLEMLEPFAPRCPLVFPQPFHLFPPQ